MSMLPDFPALLERFFTQRLMQQKQVSPHTIASYRDTFRLLLEFAHRRLRKPPSQLNLRDLDAPMISAFLNDLEKIRGVSARTRNLRLIAIRSFFKFAAFEQPDHAEQIQRVLAIPTKRFTKPQLGFLTHAECEAVLKAPDVKDWIGRRDRTLLLLAMQTGLRLSELIGLDRNSIQLHTGAHVCCHGKGRKNRSTPLTSQTVIALKAWLREPRRGTEEILFPTIHGRRLSADAVQHLLAKHVAVARRYCPSLRHKRVSPHSLRHGAAMALLQAGVDTSVIALWLGHESAETTQTYLHADMALKEAALAKADPLILQPVRFHPGDRLLNFLDAL